ncbi:MAG: hypothetical protein KC443_09285 [Anaerolineales bacterium]|nr:hypothetical protein [Anaerolineales bacterium]
MPQPSFSYKQARVHYTEGGSGGKGDFSMETAVLLLCMGACGETAVSQTCEQRGYTFSLATA